MSHLFLKCKSAGGLTDPPVSHMYKTAQQGPSHSAPPPPFPSLHTVDRPGSYVGRSMLNIAFVASALTRSRYQLDILVVHNKLTELYAVEDVEPITPGNEGGASRA